MYMNLCTDDNFARRRRDVRFEVCVRDVSYANGCNFFNITLCEKKISAIDSWRPYASYSLLKRPKKKKGPLGESNPRPPPPEGGIIPLDQAAITFQ